MKSFGSIGQFAVRLAKLAAEGQEVTHHLADRCGEHVASVARDKIGEYQGGAGPFPGWQELADDTKAQRVRQGYTENDPLLRTGELRDSISHAVDGNDVAIGSTSEIAPDHELGTERIPPRPFLGPAVIESKEHIEVTGLSTVVAWLSGRGWKRPRAINTNS